MPKVVISDTSCFIVLTKIGELEILHETFGEIFTTPEVIIEFGKALPIWINILSPVDKSVQKNIEQILDKGEASAIALALEIKDSTIILDDYKARQVAEKLGLNVTGTLGVIIKAKNNGIIPSIKPYLDKLELTNFRLTKELKSKSLIEANE